MNSGLSRSHCLKEIKSDPHPRGWVLEGSPLWVRESQSPDCDLTVPTLQWAVGRLPFPSVEPPPPRVGHQLTGSVDANRAPLGPKLAYKGRQFTGGSIHGPPPADDLPGIRVQYREWDASIFLDIDTDKEASRHSDSRLSEERSSASCRIRLFRTSL